MAIVQTLSKSSFMEEFKQSSRKDQFSYDALGAIFDYLEEYSDSTGEPVEFDMVAICCEWSECTWEDIVRDYDVDLSDCETVTDKMCAVVDYLAVNTTYIELPDSFVFVQF